MARAGTPSLPFFLSLLSCSLVCWSVPKGYAFLFDRFNCTPGGRCERVAQWLEAMERRGEREGIERVKAALKEFEARALEQEALGEEIILDRRQMVDYDRKRQKNREALNALKKRSAADVVSASPAQAGGGPAIEELVSEQEERQKGVWMFTGSMFMKLPKEAAKKGLEKDQEQLSAEIDRMQAVVKDKAIRLQRMDERLQEEAEVMASMARLSPMTS